MGFSTNNWLKLIATRMKHIFYPGQKKITTECFNQVTVLKHMKVMGLVNFTMILDIPRFNSNSKSSNIHSLMGTVWLYVGP